MIRGKIVQMLEVLFGPTSQEGARRGWKLFALAVLVGCLVSLVSVAFRIVVAESQHLLFGSYPESFSAGIATQSPWLILGIPAIGGLTVGILLNFFFPQAKGGGVEEVMVAITQRGFVHWRAVIGKFLAASTTLGTGGSAGREGPVVQMGAGVGSLIGSIFRLPDSYVKTLAGAGVAAGIAAAFNAPIAGGFFALEIILGDFALSAFGPIMIASVTSTVVSHALIGNVLEFTPPAYDFQSPVELAFYAVLGLLAGIVSAFFVRFLFRTERFFHEQLPFPPFLKPALGGLAVGCIALLVPEVMGMGYGVMNGLLTEIHLGVGLLASIIALKIVSTSLTLGSGGSGGTIVPSLFLGCTLGALVGVIFQSIVPAGYISPGALALVGMSAVIAGITQAPIMSIILFFEITKSYEIILPVMLVCILSTIVSKRLLGGSLFSLKLRDKGIDAYSGVEKTVMATIPVTDVMRPPVLVFKRADLLRSSIDILINSGESLAYVVDDERRLISTLSVRSLRRLLLDKEIPPFLIVGDIDEGMPPLVQANDSLSQAVALMARTDVDNLPVVTPTRFLVGTITRKDIFRVYDREVLRADSGGVHFRTHESDVKSQRFLDLARGYRLATVVVIEGGSENESALAGRTLADLQLRQRFGITVLTMQASGEEQHRMPDPVHRLASGDILVLVGEKDSIDAFARSYPSCTVA